MEAMGKQQREYELFRAASVGNVRLLKKMARALESGGLGEAAFLAATVDEHDDSVLQLAAKHGRVDVLRYLVEDLRLDINQPNNGKPNKAILDFTPLRFVIHEPIPSKSLPCMKLLIKAGADVNFVDTCGFTTVIFTVKHSLPILMKCLLDAGANPNIPDEFGRTAIEYAAFNGRRDMVEMLFPLTSPISMLPDWSIDGIISHVESFGLKPKDKRKCEKKIRELKRQASEAFRREEYIIAGQLYSCAMEFYPSPDDYATLLANRSLCGLRSGENNVAALSDATWCRMARPHCPKACYRQGAAYMARKEYEKACNAFADGLKLEPTNDDIANALREAREALKNARCSQK